MRLFVLSLSDEVGVPQEGKSIHSHHSVFERDGVKIEKGNRYPIETTHFPNVERFAFDFVHDRVFALIIDNATSREEGRNE